jgi:ABC-2 type transport system permease protein
MEPGTQNLSAERGRLARIEDESAGERPALRGGTRVISWRRIAAMVLRYWYLLRSSWPRLLELTYWPMVQMLTWGFLQLYVVQNAGFFARAGGTFIGAVLLWDILFRGQLGFSLSFLEEMWSRNLANLMISPLKPIEFVLAMMAMSIIRLLIGMVPVTLLALGFFGFNLYGMGFALAAFFLNLILTSWSVGVFISGVVMRNGLGAENLAWSVMFVLMPLSCVYYPVAVLPHWLQIVAWSLPPTYVFEGMRALLIDHQFRADLMIEAFAMNVALFAAAVTGFMLLLNSARRSGALMLTGE